jgi:hypothetical protein
MTYFLTLAALISCGVLTACGAQSATSSQGAEAVPSRTVGSEPAKVPRLPGAREARELCRSGSTEQIRRRFLSRARTSASRADARFLELAANPPRSASPPARAALAARVYAMTRPKAVRAGAYSGCAYELSKKTSKESHR